MKRLLLASLFIGAALPAIGAQHVRVVLDLSKSMKSNDPGRLAVLSTILLHDLAQPNPSLGDSFEVIPFDLHWRWPSAAAPPPVSTQAPIVARLRQRADFIKALQALPYEAEMTYFYPGVAAALQDLEQIKVGAFDIRTIVLVTDGVPEAPTRDAELQYIRDKLAPRLEQSGIRLYVLAFGSEADKYRDFFGDMLRSPTGASLGEFFVDPRGTQLLSYMLQIFSRSFGYSPDAARPLPGTAALDLEGRRTPARVAVAVFSARSQPPQLHLTPPSGGSVNDPEGVQSAGVNGGSYSLMWVLSPSAGDYGLVSDVSSGSVAVLRPTQLALEVAPAPPHKQAERTLAGTPFPLRVIVRSPTGARGDPGPVDLSFRTFGERMQRAGGDAYAWESERKAPPPGPGTATAQERTYDIVTEFREDPEKPGTMYVGYLEVEARRGEAVVGALVGPHAHRVEVHPLLSISPLPLSSYVSSNALERGQQACTQFTFHLDAGQLPHPERPGYPIRTVLIADPALLDHELRQASFLLDGQILEVDGRPGAQPGAWYKGRPLSSEELIGPHEICVRIGKPTTGSPGRPLELSLAATLLEDPYDEFRVVQPFNLKVLVSSPTFLERWRVMFLGALVVCGLGGLLWYLRDRPAVPADLRYAVGREDSTAPLASRDLDERPLLARLLGWVAESAVFAPGEERVLGRVRPVDAELFQLRTARGVRVEPLHHGEKIEIHRGLATLAVHRLYRLRGDAGSYLFRMEYR
jgi:hypothetical protein